MNERLTQRKVKKTLMVYIFIMLLCMASVLLLYECFAHQLVRAMYEGKSIGALNNLIKYQYKKPVGHYLDLANTIFYKMWLLSGIAFSLLVTAKSLLDFADNKRWLSSESILNIKIVFFSSLGIRVMFLPFVTNLLLATDEGYYWNVPKYLAKGDFVSVVLRPPLWGCLLAIPAWFFDHPFMGRLFATVIGACTPVLIYLLAEKVFNKRTGLVAALIYAAYPEHIGYSHYLWSEILFGFLCLLSLYLFFVFVQDRRTNLFLLLSFFVAGLALLAKEFAVILVVGLSVTLFFLQTKNIMRKILPACLLFLLPAIGYSLVASRITNHVIVLADAPIGNLIQATAADSNPKFSYSHETREDSILDLIHFLKERSLHDTLRSMQKQFYNLWTPNSFPVARVLATHRLQAWSYGDPQVWSYGVSSPWPWVFIIAGFYIFVVVIGLAGLCLAETAPFRIFSIVSLVCLSSTSIFAFLCSRFRLPFMFIFVMYTAYTLVNAKVLMGNLKNRKRLAFPAFFLAIFAHIVYCKIHTLGSWG